MEGYGERGILEVDLKTIIAIDPGASGAIAIRDDASVVCVTKMPDTPKDIYDYLGAISCGPLCTPGRPIVAVVERVGTYMPGNSAVAAVKFARHCGHLDMALLALSIPTVLVLPRRWMSDTIGSALSREKAERKRQIKEHMQRLYPGISVTLDTADALGILTWAIKEEGQ